MYKYSTSWDPVNESFYKTFSSTSCSCVCADATTSLILLVTRTTSEKYFREHFAENFEWLMFNADLAVRFLSTNRIIDLPCAIPSFRRNAAGERVVYRTKHLRFHLKDTVKEKFDSLILVKIENVHKYQ